MNLLTDIWIPVLAQGKHKLIRLQDVLCHDEDFNLALPRDDMELACLQLMICLTQVVFPPEDEKTLKQRIEKPLTEEEYKQGLAPFIDWFDLNHPETPFMQIRGVKAEKSTPIQKLFVGLPEGNNHAFFNEPGELKKVCSSCAVIALFNQNTNAPGFSGKQKAGIRGAIPITSLVSFGTLRMTIWSNVLHKQTLENLRLFGANDKPVWVHPIVPMDRIEQYIKETRPKANKHKRMNIPCYEIGLFRGLFWLPVLIELTSKNDSKNQKCDFCGSQSDITYKDFYLGSDFYFEIIGNWSHPHSPRFWNLKKGEKEEKYLSFTTTAPAWTQLSRFVIAAESEKEGQQPAAVVSQFRNMSGGAAMQLLVGGYRNKQASILQRRHELLSLSKGWERHPSELKQVIDQAIEIKTTFRNKLYGFAKASGAGGVHEQAEALFYNNSEPLIHACLHQMDWREAARTRQELRDKLINLSWDIFEEVTRPYRHEPKMIKALSVTRKTLRKAFTKLRGET